MTVDGITALYKNLPVSTDEHQKIHGTGNQAREIFVNPYSKASKEKITIPNITDEELLDQIGDIDVNNNNKQSATQKASSKGTKREFNNEDNNSETDAIDNYDCNSNDIEFHYWNEAFNDNDELLADIVENYINTVLNWIDHTVPEWIRKIIMQSTPVKEAYKHFKKYSAHRVKSKIINAEIKQNDSTEFDEQNEVSNLTEHARVNVSESNLDKINELKYIDEKGQAVYYELMVEQKPAITASDLSQALENSIEWLGNKQTNSILEFGNEITCSSAMSQSYEADYSLITVIGEVY